MSRPPRTGARLGRSMKPTQEESIRGWRKCMSCNGEKRVLRATENGPRYSPCYACRGQGGVHIGMI